MFYVLAVTKDLDRLMPWFRSPEPLDVALLLHVWLGWVWRGAAHICILKLWV
jgi:hypothetical protein